MAGSAFNPLISDSAMESLLNIPQPAREDTISIYGNGLYLPFTKLPRFADAFVDAFRIGKARHSILGYQSPDSLLKAELNVLAGYEHTSADKNYGFWYKGFRSQASYGKHWEFNTNWWNGVFTGDKEAASTSALIDGYYKHSEGNLRLDNISCDVAYNTTNLSLALGRDTFPLGNSLSGSIILNDRVNDYAYFLAEGKAGDFSLSFMHASLMADSTYSIYDAEHSVLNRKNYPDKYMVVHQLGYHPRQNLSFFAGEMVIYGNRGIDVNYLLPNAFWRATEHNLWDRDNVLIFAGVTYQPAAKVLLYCQAALDELSYGKLFSNWWGNKYALQGGIRYTLPQLSRDSNNATLIAELTAVRPFTYTHYMNHTMSSHDRRPLGYPKGSNIVDFSTELQLPYKGIITWQNRFSYSKQGSFGSSWATNYNDVFPGDFLQNGTAKWFQGTVTTTTTLKSSLLLDVFAHHRLLIGYQASRQAKWDNSLNVAWQLSY